MVFPQPQGPKFNLDQNKFDDLIQHRGVNVLYEKSLQCPCKTQSHNYITNCQNCGGTGWVFVNPIETIMALQRMPLRLDIEQFRMVGKGTIGFTCEDKYRPAFMDRITRLNSLSTYQQVLELKERGGIYFCHSIYDIKRMHYIGFFEGTDKKLRQLQPDEYTLDRNFIKINDISSLPDPDATNLGDVVTLTIRYDHNPTFHVTDFDRENMDNWFITPNKTELQRMPIHGTAQRAEYILNREDLNGNGVLNNDYLEDDCDTECRECKI